MPPPRRRSGPGSGRSCATGRRSSSRIDSPRSPSRTRSWSSRTGESPPAERSPICSRKARSSARSTSTASSSRWSPDELWGVQGPAATGTHSARSRFPPVRTSALRLQRVVGWGAPEGHRRMKVWQAGSHLTEQRAATVEDWSWAQTRRRLGILVRLAGPYPGRTLLAVVTLVAYTLVALLPPYITNDIEALDQLLTDGLSSLVQNGLVLVGTAVVLFILDWRLALATLLVLPFMVAATAWFRMRSNRAYRRVRERLRLLTPPPP